MTTSTKEINQLICVVAKRKAERAVENYLETHGESPINCGFAWVKVSGARGNKAKDLKEMGFEKPYTGTGLTLWNPSESATQDMSAKMAGAEVYAKYLRSHGFDAKALCRLD